MNNPLVSICIPTYNGEKFLVECLNSCINQSYNNYEIIICDDGSSDNSISIIEGYASKHNFIKFYKSEKNLGLVGNWNKCLDLSSGTWVKYVFQDDYITHDCLQKFVNAIENCTQLIVCKRNFVLPEAASNYSIDYYTNVVRTLENTTEYRGSFFSPKLISVIAVENICLNFIGEPSLIFFKKDIIKEVGYFNSSLKQICDLEFALRISSKYGLKYIPEKLCAFRIHNDSTTNNNVTNKYYELRYIEPLLFSYHLLFNLEYDTFRSHLSFFQMFKLKLYFRFKAYKAYSVNKKEDRNHYLFNETNKKYREIYDYKNGNFLIKLMALAR